MASSVERCSGPVARPQRTVAGLARLAQGQAWQSQQQRVAQQQLQALAPGGVQHHQLTDAIGSGHRWEMVGRGHPGELRARAHCQPRPLGRRRPAGARPGPVPPAHRGTAAGCARRLRGPASAPATRRERPRPLPPGSGPGSGAARAGCPWPGRLPAGVAAPAPAAGCPPAARRRTGKSGSGLAQRGQRARGGLGGAATVSASFTRRNLQPCPPCPPALCAPKPTPTPMVICWCAPIVATNGRPRRQPMRTSKRPRSRTPTARCWPTVTRWC